MLTATLARALLCLATPDVVDGPPIAWSIDPALTCPTVAQLETAYRAKAGSNAGSGPSDLVVSVALTPGAEGGVHLDLSAEPGGLRADRAIDASASRCNDLTTTVVILVEAWLRDLPELLKAPPAADPSLAPSSAVALTPQEPVFEVSSSAAVQQPHKSSKLGLDLCAAGGVWIASGTDVAPSVAVSAELDFSSLLGLAAFASFQGNLSVDDAPAGSLLVHRQLFGALATITLPTVKGLEVNGLTSALLAGLVLWHGKAESFGYPVSTSSDQLVPGLAAGGRLEQRLAGPLFLDLQTSFIFLNRSLNLQIERPGGATVTLSTLPTFALDLSLGIGVTVL